MQNPPSPLPILESHIFLRFNACPEKDFGLIDQNSSVLETGEVWKLTIFFAVLDDLGFGQNLKKAILQRFADPSPLPGKFQNSF